MIGYIVRRLLLAVPTLLAVFTVIFFLMRVAPGDPAAAALGDYASAEAVEARREALGLNEPLWRQYVVFLADLARGDLGQSLISQQPIKDQVVSVLPHTLQLTAAAIVIGVLLGVPLGIVTARRQNQRIDYIGRIVSLAGLSLPSFYFGVLLIFFLAVKVKMFPAIGAGDFGDVPDNLRRLVLPALTLGLIETAYITRMTRAVMLDVLSEDFVRTARAKGLIERLVLVRHALRAGLVPLVSLIGIFAISLIGSSVLVEEVFARPGLGKLMIGAAKQKDYTALQSIMVIYGLIIVLINLAVDLLYTAVDPRVRVG